MAFKPAADWVEAFPVEPETPKPHFPPARRRVRRTPILPAPENECAGKAVPDTERRLAPQRLEMESTIAPELDFGARSDPAYAVGYKRPPLHTQFKVGQSGNPRGRPRKAKSLNTIVRETLGGKIAVRTATGTKKISRIEAVLQKTLEQAMKGNPKAQTELIKLWRGAVPDEIIEDVAACEEDLTAADLAMLEAYRAQLGQNERASS